MEWYGTVWYGTNQLYKIRYGMVRTLFLLSLIFALITPPGSAASFFLNYSLVTVEESRGKEVVKISHRRIILGTRRLLT